MAGLISGVCAIGLAAILLLAAVSKLRSPDRTIGDFESLGLAGAAALARLVPAAEAATATLLVVAPRWGGPAAFALLAGFTVILVGVVRSGRVATCACFGGTSGEPVSNRHLVRNAVLMMAAVAASTIDGAAFDPLA